MVLAPESGVRLEDARGFTRDVMARMERDLGAPLDWIAVDHLNTDNPHTHVIVRGVRRDGIELRLPREYVSHGLRENARAVATDWLGPRGIEDERLARTREVEARSMTRLDRMIERDLDGQREILLQRLGADRDPAIANALRARARELEKQGFARETRRNVIRFEPGWTGRLEARRALDVRRELVRARLYAPRMGVVRGEVRALGPRGEDPDRAALVIDAGY
jgi:type IV secretory pathway VirD2 relaxase